MGLTEQERKSALMIMESDAYVRSILETANHKILHIGPWLEGSRKVGAIILVRFDAPVWIEGQFSIPPSNKTRKAELWAGNLAIFVDLSLQKVTGVWPGMTIPNEEAPIEDRRIPEAVQVALRHPIASSLGERVEALLCGIYHYPQNSTEIAYFFLRSSKGGAIVAVDLNAMEAVGRYSGYLHGWEP